jgi:hypothetical protein
MTPTPNHALQRTRPSRSGCKRTPSCAGSSEGHHGRRAVYFPFTDYSVSGTTRLPHHLSYVLQVEVLQPSMRPSDLLAIEAFTTVRPKRSNQSLQPTAGRSDASREIMKTPPLQPTLAPASGG